MPSEFDPTGDAGGWRYLFELASDGIGRLVPTGTFGLLMGWIPLTVSIEWTFSND